MMTPEDVIFKLGQLEPPEIARGMKDAGVQAKRCDTDACAVTQYTYLETKAKRILTGNAILWYDLPSGGWTVVPLPETVKQFISNFDDNHYPELDADSPENM